MKYRFAGALLVGLLSMSVSTSQGADINITVNGRVVARPCNIATTNASIDLGDLFTFSLKSAGSTSAWHDTALSLTNCPIGTSRVVATFSGMVDNTGYYKNQGTAGNIQLELQDDSGRRLNNGAAKLVQVDDSSQSASFPLKVRVLSVKGGATQGTIQAVINVTYIYA